MQRGRGDEVRGLVRSLTLSGPEEWKDIKFMVFDCKSELVYEERMAQIEAALTGSRNNKSDKGHTDNIKVVERLKCSGYHHLYSTLTQIIENARRNTLISTNHMNRKEKEWYYASPIQSM